MLSTKGFETLGDEFISLFEYMVRCQYFKLSRLAIPMLTVIADTGMVLDMRHIYSLIQNSEDTLFEPHTSSISEGRTLMFRHCQSPITLQVFASGKLQLAGCTSHIDAMALTSTFLHDIGKAEACTVQFHVKLLNVTCMLQGINLKVSDPDFLRSMNASLQRLHPLDDKHRAEKREHYSACVVYMRNATDQKISCRLFSSGCVSITAQRPSDILRMVQFIVDFFQAHKQYTYEPSNKDVIKAQKHDFWSFTNLMSVLSGDEPVAHTHPPTRFLVEGCRYCQTYGNIYCKKPDNAKTL